MATGRSPGEGEAQISTEPPIARQRPPVRLQACSSSLICSAPLKDPCASSGATSAGATFSSSFRIVDDEVVFSYASTYRPIDPIDRPDPRSLLTNDLNGPEEKGSAPNVRLNNLTT
ncbi:hypothetical protein ZHAS_00017806 [Anopheles sinensis]|uniref:Uncharacterized protein n=1 Tax=Anopheles sinensis TaxID=74873 RepID=A0A084WHU5_ANOSI|nr:hypothetical protein ZHAS_00017806 [Anopheles sinensis]